MLKWGASVQKPRVRIFLVKKGIGFKKCSKILLVHLVFNGLVGMSVVNLIEIHWVVSSP